MVRLTVLAVVCAVVASVVAAPVAAAVDVGTVDGNADAEGDGEADLVTLTIKVRTDNGETVGGADVTVSHSQGTNETRTRANGNTLVDVPRGDDVTIEVDHGDYIRNFPVTVSSVGENEEVVVTMYPRATAQVNVEDESGPVEDAKVTLTKLGRNRVAAEGRTDGNGFWQSDQIEAGTYQVAVVKTGYSRTVTELEVRDLVSTTVTVEETTVQVRVRVVDDHFQSPEPIEGANVAIELGGQTVKQAVTGSNGNTRISVGVNGQYKIRVTKDGYQTVEDEFILGEEGKEFTYRINRERSLSLTAVNNRVLAGESVLVRVKNAYGERVEGATITRNGTEVGSTDAEGELQVSIPDAGTFEISASKDGVTSDGVIVQGQRAATETPTETPTATPTETPTATTTTPENDSVLGLPGFGTVTAALAVLLALAALAVRSRHRS
ncbi:hypothetical protein BRD00_10970 [Halobacteriales archaeon QS_8_69_26]|nr:MAG: hypothetical protein BRD00_10970 [Halobacteriales archaeon QS_8_69_26]